MLFSTVLSVAALALATSPAAAKQLVVKNQCKFDITVSKVDNGQAQGTNDGIAQGNSKTYDLAEDWQGRLFGRNGCSGTDCTSAGANNPASLAEFTFKGAGGQDFYDLSLVDGFNLPMKIDPVGGKTDPNNKYQCGSPVCSPVPTCPDDMKVIINGQFSSCQSACSKFGSEEYCCTGSHNTPNTCPPNQYSQQVKAACPTAYSYAYDDRTSTFTCTATGYNIVFCP